MLRNVSVLVSSSIGAQLLGIAFLPLLSRLYDDEAFGSFQIYISVLNVLIIASAFRLEFAFLEVRSDRHFQMLLGMVMRFILLVSLLMLLIVVLFGGAVVRRFGDLEGLLLILPAAALFAGIFNALTVVLVRQRRYRLNAGVRFVRALAYVGFAILFALTPFIGIGIVLADILSRIVSTIFILLRAPGVFSGAIAWLPMKKFLAVVRRFREYPQFSFPGSLMSASLGLIVTLAFLGQFDKATAGQYALVDRFILLPVGLIAAATAQVVTGDFSQSIRDRDSGISRAFRRTLFYLLMIGVGPAVLVFLASPTLVPLIFGQHWQLAGHLCAAAAPIALVRFVAGPFNALLVVANRKRIQFAWELLRFLLTAGIIGTVSLMDVNDPVTLMWAYSGAIVVAQVTHLALVNHVIRKLSTTNEA